MVLTGAQIGACFQTYWQMWLTNGLSGLLFMGIQIGIAAFYLNKFNKKSKPSVYKQRRHSASSTRRIVSPTDIDTNEESYFESSPRPRTTDNISSRNTSAGSERILGATQDNEQFTAGTLEAINGARRRYNAEPLEINEQLSEIAQRWAEQMARSGKLEHSPTEWRTFRGQILGENYAASFQSELTADRMVKKWLKEGKRYMFGFDGRKDTENFTQLVWRSSQEIGIGRARSEDGNWWYGAVVFDPPGNIPNQYAHNVFLPPE